MMRDCLEENHINASTYPIASAQVYLNLPTWCFYAFYAFYAWFTGTDMLCVFKFKFKFLLNDPVTDG
jgi:hypothetical protein